MEHSAKFHRVSSKQFRNSQVTKQERKPNNATALGKLRKALKISLIWEKRKTLGCFVSNYDRGLGVVEGGMAHTGFGKLEIIHGENDILCAYIT